MLRYETDRFPVRMLYKATKPGFSRLVQHPGRKRSASILTTRNPHEVPAWKINTTALCAISTH